MNLLDYIRTLATGDYIDMAHLVVLLLGAWSIAEGALNVAADTIERMQGVRK
ncbi:MULTISPECIES: hypothetical protein [Xanthomonas]|uniref:hypothetical protein n=1 Tax=Xanthomonas TaxID=338 RepID=UPI000B08063E|nr:MULTISPECIES: hypothetical protein [Xanthomonas]MBO9747220.1 hypothetical protein [Xanthomonas phaseoli pv. dieffenbachiae]MBO9749823.1 hypothetical protein [Xanthomonas phaseoli pv. dieffenbachiae]MBO9875838.1 hypothetical protein [Xanthomonas sp. D-99]MBO9890276.1 hypothetical protein [Xanthomonas sp. D-36-1]